MCATLAGCTGAPLTGKMVPTSALPADPPAEALPDAAWTYLQCYDPGPDFAGPPVTPELVSVGENGDHVYVDAAGNVSLIRTRGGKAEMCLIVNQTGGWL